MNVVRPAISLDAVQHRLIDPVSYDELIAVTEVWPDTALGLHDRDLRLMEHLVGAQNRRMHHEEGDTNAPDAAASGSTSVKREAQR